MQGDPQHRNTNEVERRFYRPELDGLRCFAFLAVFACHTFPHGRAIAQIPLLGDLYGATVAAGAFGVDIFFCLSAYLITELLTREREKTGGIDLVRFWTRRALRIVPLYWFAVFACWKLLPAVLDDAAFPAPYVIAFATFIGNWRCVGGWPASPVFILWSVCVEEQFYLCWPLLLRVAPRNTIAYLSGILIVTSLIARVVVVHLALPAPATWCLTITRLDSLAVGALVSTARHGATWVIASRLRAAGVLVSIAALVGVAYAMPIDAAPTLAAAIIGYPAVAVACGVILLCTLDAQSGLIAWLVRNRITQSLGRVSYGLYVYHLAVFRLLSHQRLAHIPIVLQPLVALAATILVAGLSWVLLERPFLYLKQRFAVVQSGRSLT